LALGKCGSLRHCGTGSLEHFAYMPILYLAVSDSITKVAQLLISYCCEKNINSFDAINIVCVGIYSFCCLQLCWTCSGQNLSVTVQSVYVQSCRLNSPIESCYTWCKTISHRCAAHD